MEIEMERVYENRCIGHRGPLSIYGQGLREAFPVPHDPLPSKIIELVRQLEQAPSEIDVPKPQEGD
jgi:hypothetical protein